MCGSGSRHGAPVAGIRSATCRSSASADDESTTDTTETTEATSTVETTEDKAPE